MSKLSILNLYTYPAAAQVIVSHVHLFGADRAKDRIVSRSTILIDHSGCLRAAARGRGAMRPSSCMQLNLAGATQTSKIRNSYTDCNFDLGATGSEFIAGSSEGREGDSEEGKTRSSQGIASRWAMRVSSAVHKVKARLC